MDPKMKTLRRDQLDKFFHANRSILNSEIPKKGWIREIRESLGMSMEALGRRMGVIKQRIERIEKDELESKLTLETMRKVAEALDCEFVYFIKPKQTLAGTITDEAIRVADVEISALNKTMTLEKQRVSSATLMLKRNEIAADLIKKYDRKLWK